MVWVNSRSVAAKLEKIFLDNTVLPSEWKYAIPLHIVHMPLPLVLNAKNFADGMQHNIELYGINIPPSGLAHDPYSQDYLLE